MEESTTSIPLGWVSPLLVFGALFLLLRWLLLGFLRSHVQSLKALTGGVDPFVWVIDGSAHLLIILFVFYFLSAFMPGEGGQQFRAALSSLVMHAVKLIFKVLEKGLDLIVKLLVRVLDLETRAKKREH